MQLLAVTGFTDLFHEPIPEDTLGYIASYPTDILLMKLSKINALLFQQRDDEVIDVAILKDVIFAEVPGFEKIDEFKPYFSGEKRWFAEGPIGLLMMDCLKNFKTVDRSNTVNTLELARNFLKTILIYNQLYYSRFREEDMETPQALFKMEAMQQGYLRAKGPLKLVTLMKFAFLSKFLDVHAPLKNEALMYCKKMEIGNPWIFGKFFLFVLAWAMEQRNHGKHILNVNEMPEKLMREFAIDPEALQAKDQLSLNMDVVAKPFYFATPTHAFVLDYSFFQYPIENGFFFSFFRHGSSALRTQHKNYLNFKSYIALEFFEKYLVGGLLRAIFQKRGQKIVSTDKYQDFVIRASPSDVFVFEVKMSDLHVHAIDQLDYVQFKRFLDERFLSEKAKGASDKGVQQIIRQVGYLAEEDSELREKLELQRSGKLNIYPVIICSEHHMNVSGVNDYLNEAFENRSQHLKSSFQSIKPLAVVHIDFLLKFFGPLKRNSSLFSELLNSYAKSSKNLKKKHKENGGVINYFLAHRSFSNYIETKEIQSPYSATIDEIENSFDLEVKGPMDEPGSFPS